MHGGIDEAGRGPVIGPLVVAGVVVPDPCLLEEMGCKDSKRLSPSKRRRIARLLEDHPDVRVAVRVLKAEDIDERRSTQTLNEIEVDLFREVAVELGARRLWLDAADVDAVRFGARVAEALPDGTEVVSEHKADDHHAVVAAASIVAKVTRDGLVEDLARRLERQIPYKLGSGYPSDPHTKTFLAAWVDRFGDLPPGTRRSWKTAAALMGPRQSTLDL